ncbi:MAG: sodium:proton antiporter [Candidatus Krumholzibacteriia bacterium]
MPELVVELQKPAVVVALALAVGMIAQTLALHLRVPAIVVLLGAGVALGPDGLGLLHPDALGDHLHGVVGFGVAVILFEGGLNLRWSRIRHSAGPLRRLLTIGTLLTAAGATGATWWLLDWNLGVAVVFGALIVVTGPTVITPLLRRIRVRHRVETLLESEGVLVDGVGAVAAVVALEVITGHSDEVLSQGLMGPPARLGTGILAGALCGGFLTVALRIPRLVPSGQENILVLAVVLACYQVSNALVSESGVVAAIAAGVVMANMGVVRLRELQEFKGQLTILLIGLLFVLLAADVRVAEVRDLGWNGLLVVLILVVVVRPLAVWLSCWGGGLGWRDKAFLAWVAPRGIVAAAIGSLFGERLAPQGLAGGDELRGMVFLVIAVTVVVLGGTAEYVARALGLRRPRDQGFAILGAHELPRLLAARLQAAGEPVVLLDANASNHRRAQDEGFTAIFGNPLEDRVLLAAGVESRRAVYGLLSNTATNLLFARKALQDHRAPAAGVGIMIGDNDVEPEAVRAAGLDILFGQPFDLEQWTVRLRHEDAVLESWRWRDGGPEDDDRSDEVDLPRELRSALLPVLHVRDGRARPITQSTRLRSGDRVEWLVATALRPGAAEWLESTGWRPVPAEDHHHSP